MLFHFVLTPLDKVPPWGEPGALSLSWYGLSDGQYWLEVADDELFRHSDQYRREEELSPYLDYQVVRLYDDLDELFPDVMEPVPSSLTPYLRGDGARDWDRVWSRWRERLDERPTDDPSRDLADAASKWIRKRTLNTDFLGWSIRIRMWSDADSVFIAWNNPGKTSDGVPFWSTVEGTFRLARNQFIEEVRSFHKRFVEAMNERADQVLAGALPSEVSVDLAMLEKDRQWYNSNIERMLGKQPVPTDWDRVAAAIQQIEQESAARSGPTGRRRGNGGGQPRR